LGLLIGCCYIIFDTQIIIFNAEAGRKEPFTDALNLFTDLFKIFMEITKILTADKKKKNKD
jgi:FtsH-binding integral membrane protein